MPRVDVNRNPDTVSNGLMRKISDALPMIVARSLGPVSKHPVNSASIMVQVVDRGQFDKCDSDLYIQVSCKGTEVRLDSMDVVREDIEQQLREIKGDIAASVRLVLPDVSFGKC